MSQAAHPTVALPSFFDEEAAATVLDVDHLQDGLTIERVFSKEGENPFDSVAWHLRDAAIRNPKGEAIFEQKNVEFPTDWSLLASNVVASKYFYGDLARSGFDPDEGGRERSLRQLIHRVTRTIADWGLEQGYFATKEDGECFYDELTWLCVHQYGAFNSPVWFNVGLHHQYGVRDTGGKRIYGWDAEKEAVVAVDPYERPQASACFIISVADSIDDIWKLMGESARLFKFGSGVGADWSGLRSSREKLSGGGTPSGPVSFMRVQDATGGTIKSGGKCLAPYTKVYTEQGPVAVEELAGRMFYVLSYDPPAGRMKVKRAQAWRSGRKEVVRVHTDKGHFDVSFDHPVKLSSGGFELAGNLEVGQSLFQSTIDPHEGYARVSLRDGKKGRELLHRMVAADVLGHDLDGLVVHHRDEAKLNNHPDNLEAISQAEHARLHGEALVAAGEHVFLYAKDDPRFDASGENNGMHHTAAFWKDKKRVRQYRQQKRAEMRGRDPLKLQRAAVWKRYMNLGYQLINAGHDISTLDKFFAAYEQEIGRVDSKPRRRQAFEKQFGGYDGFLHELAEHNHRVVAIEWLGDMDVYSVEVACPTPDDKSPQSGHNYLIWSGDNESLFGSGIVVSNTRRAAIMQTLKVWHPDIMEFVEAKQNEERKAWALIEQGFDGSFNGPAYGSVAFQNVNQSVRVTDAFMEAAEQGASYGLRAVTTGKILEEADAAHVLHKIAEGTHVCGDPGVQYEDTIQRWHTVKNTGPINSSNPCVTGDTLVATSEGLRRIDSLLGETPRVVGLDDKMHRTTRVIETGVRPVYRLRTRAGYEVKLTADHRVWTENRGDVPAATLTRDDVVRLIGPRFGTKTLDVDVAEYVGLMLGDGCVSAGVATLAVNKESEHLIAEKAAAVANRFERQTWHRGVNVTERATSLAVVTGAASVREMLAEYAVLDEGASAKRLTAGALQLNREATAALLRGLFTADGTVADYGEKSQYVSLDATAEELLQQVQLLLLGFGVKSKLYRNRRPLGATTALLPDGMGGLKEYRVEQMHSLRISRSSRVRFEKEIGFMPESPKAAALQALNGRVGTYRDRMLDRVASLELLGEEPVYDLTEPVTDHFVANGVAVHNCSEYMHLDNSACNLASLNLRKYQREDGSFDVERFRAASRIFITAMEILVDNAGYPSAEIAKNSHAYRPLGLGFANLGALLMAMGLPYDSDEGRAVAGAVTAIEHAEAYARSAEIAANRKIGPFDGFARNRAPMLDVMQLHHDAVEDVHPRCPAYLVEAARASMDRMLALGERHGYRNAQSTVLAPTGTIAFMMDCDTTGVEPDIALVKYKLLAGKGDGMLKIVNQTVPEALHRLGYDEDEVEAILAFVDEHDTIEGAPHLRDEHLAVFDCAFKPFKGTRSIHHAGHIRMMAACQPFISGAISKCVTGDTLILTEHGIIPIGQFYEGEVPDSFRRCNLKLASLDEPQEADLFYYGGVRQTIKLTLADGRTIEGTPNHRVKVANQDGYDWKYLREITMEDHVSIRLGTDMWAGEDVEFRFRPSPLYGGQKEIRVPERMAPALGRLLGYYIAEGNKNRSNWTVCITNNHTSVLKRCQAMVRDLFGLEGRIVTDPRNGVKSFVVASKSLYELLDYLGCEGTSGTKEIPWSVLQSSRETVREFIGGLWLDGYVRRKDGMTAICLKSARLIEQLQVVLNNFGIRANIIQKYNKKYDSTFHQLCIHGRDVCRFAELFTLDEPHKRRSLADATAVLAEKQDGAWSDVVPCYREEMQQAIYANHDTVAWRNVFDKRTHNVSRRTVTDFYKQYPLPELEEIVENDVHFVQVREITSGFAEVYDFQVPANHAFLGNGIINHNTVNMPENATVDEIADAYAQGWKLGLKALAIYRENSKRSQPLSTSKGGNTKNKEAAVDASGDGMVVGEPEIVEKVVEKVIYKPTRRRLPDERPALTHKFSLAGHEGYLHVGLYPDTGMPGEIFITMAKQGSTISGLMDAFATSISIALQYGVPLEDLCAKFSYMRFEPSGFTNNRAIPMAKSIMDYIFRYLSLKFLGRPHENGEAPDPERAVAEVVHKSGPAADETQMTLPFDKPGASVVEQTIASFLDRAEHTHARKASIHIEVDAKASFQNQADAPPCSNCGAITVRSGACYSCLNCGASSGCG